MIAPSIWFDRAAAVLASAAVFILIHGLERYGLALFDKEAKTR